MVLVNKKTHSRTPSLPSLTESESDSLGSSRDGLGAFGDIVEESLDCMATILAESYDENEDAPVNAVLAIEAALDVDDAMSWLEFMQAPPLHASATRQVRQCL